MRHHKSPELWVVTANRLSDGAVVFMGSDRTWTRDLGFAAIARTTDEAQSILSLGENDAAAARVVGPYLVAIERIDGQPKPVTLRERIRVDGLTFRAIAADSVAYL